MGMFFAGAAVFLAGVFFGAGIYAAGAGGKAGTNKTGEATHE